MSGENQGPETEQRGPYFIERGKENIVVVRASITYSALHIAPLEVKKLSVRKNGKINMIGPMVLGPDEKLLLSAAGESDVVVKGGQG